MPRPHWIAAPIVLALTAGAASAHHGWSSYDLEKVMRPTTPVVASSWGSPHASLVVDVEGRRWDVVLAPVSRMSARGLVEADIAVGKTVTLVAYPRKDGTREMRAERIIVGDKTVELR